MDDTTIRILQLTHQGYTCGQIIMKMGLEDHGGQNPAMIRAMAGLAYGCGGGRGSCGALAAGACLLALHAGRESDEVPDAGRLAAMLQELFDWFSDRVGDPLGAVTCDAVVGTAGRAEARQRCGALVAETYAKVSQILLQNEDPADLTDP